MFEHRGFRTYTFENVPIGYDIFIMDVRWIEEYERAWVRLFDDDQPFDPVGYIGYAAARCRESTL
jgi:hypothetical protein